jgi:cellulose synthase/poly-beta-1,6-N-acetylglucosamine synthase-like glycosyltransferase
MVTEKGMRFLFWLSAFLIGYVYVGYPAVLVLWARVAERGPDAAPVRGSEPAPPAVSIIVAVRNEAARLSARLDNLLSLDYPPDRRQIIVVSDGSTDQTPEILAAFRDHIEAIALPPGGKAAALNAGVAHARHDVLIFADARQTFARDAIRALVAPLADPSVGGVTGELVLGCESSGGRRTGTDRRRANTPVWRGTNRRTLTDRRSDAAASTIAEGVGLYWRYEKTLRRLESTVGSTLGATGAIYALRRSLWRPLPENTVLDDVLVPMRAVLAGQRMVFNDRATAFDGTPGDASAEARRKIRTLAGNVQILWLEPRLLVPVVNPVWIQYVSHKVGRLLVPYALITLLAASIALAGQRLLFTLALVAQCLVYLLGGYGAWLERKAAHA